MLRFLLHYGIHIIVPIAVGLLFFKDKKIWIILILLSGILIDFDHLFANPIFDPNRCSINFHPFHSYWAIVAYIFLFLYKNTRVIGLALLIHIFADSIDCFFLFSEAN
ncbi:DUF6122 family protein [uncultured Eudoraea sp.]|uniref:DUF6122 family protein n=1 Tax=uncultured Eudoraea sp. TaxID=1035614 RepID=UPI002623F3D9|nr:DUF6122 family protein [uncultured Eudoraea sp.]